MRITVIQEGRETGVQALDRDLVRVGRHPANDVVLPAREVSMFHGEFRREGGGFVYHDLGSTNGSTARRADHCYPVDESRDLRWRVANGDAIVLGKDAHLFELRVAASETTVTSPPEATTGEAIVATEREQLEAYSATFEREALLELLDFTARTTGGVETDALLEILAESALRLFHKGNHVEVHLLDAASDEFKPVLALDRMGGRRSRPVSRTVMRRILSHGEAVVFTDADPGFEDSESLKGQGVRAGICAPLWNGEQVIGFVQVDRRDVLLLPFDHRDLAVLAVFAHLAALGITNARLHAGLILTVSELRTAHADMQRLAFYDPITGLENRAMFLDRLRQAGHVAMRQGVATALLYLDLDNFKRINDTLGHDAGDAVLRTLASRLKASVRKVDTVARIGGDEFAILLADVGDISGVNAAARKVLEALSMPMRVPAQSLRLSASVGISLIPRDGTDELMLLKNADLAMYRAKARGGSQIQFFTEEMNREVEQSLALEIALHAGLRGNQFLLHYQPIVRMGDGSLAGFEALMRWMHPERGLVPPDEFIPAAEKTGIITGLGHWALGTACASSRTLLAGAGVQRKLAVNLSVRQLRDPGLASQVQRIIEQTGIEPGNLALEITESMLMDDVNEAAKALGSLKDIGLILSIDDFGTGFSSLSHLKRYPIDIVKIDRSFVSGIPHDRNDREITAGVLALAKKLHLTVVAEGVETAEQEAFLRDNGCDLAQGFLFGQPEDMDQLRRTFQLPEPG